MQRVEAGRAALIIIFIFLLSLVAHIAIQVAMWIHGAIYEENVREATLKILIIYSVPLAALLGPLFKKQNRASQRIPGTTYIVALSMSVIWNLLLVYRSVMFATQNDDQESTLFKYLDDVSAASTFLVIGVLSYFSTSRDSKK
jgi:hypothetical protein